MRVSWGLLIFGIFWALFVAAFGAIAFAGIHRDIQMACAATVKGIIIDCQVKVDHDEDGTSRWLDLNYQYVVAGNTYQGSRFSYSFAGSGDPEALAFPSTHKPGDACLVHYLPSDPAVCALKAAQGIDPGHIFLVFFTLPFFLVGVGLLRSALPGFEHRSKNDTLKEIAVWSCSYLGSAILVAAEAKANLPVETSLKAAALLLSTPGLLYVTANSLRVSQSAPSGLAEES